MSDLAQCCPNCGSKLVGKEATCTACLLTMALDEQDSLPALQSAFLDEPASAAPFHAFGDYEIVREIARGGMGVVYHAHQISMDRPVALKFLTGGSLSASARQRFELETRVAAALDHPNIVPVYDCGEHERRPYFAMRLIEGGTLADGSERKPASLVAEIARAIHYAHQHGVLHRDLKPSNILIEKETGEPFVTDFGVAKFVDRNDGLTQTVSLLGTPNYMSPEQCRGETDHVTAASDVYALGIILYELLSGTPPFHDDSTLGVLRSIAEEPPPPLDRLRVDGDLETICRKCLEKEPARRYASAAALADDLERWERGEPIAARPTGTFESAMKWIKRRPFPAAMIAFAALALALGASVAFWQAAEAKASAETLARNLYAADMKIAQEAVADGRFVYARSLLANHPPELRGWIWRWLWQQSRPMHTQLLLGHDKPVNAVALSDDGALLASGSDDGTVRLWDTASGRELDRYSSEGDAPFIEVAFTANDSLLYSLTEKLLDVDEITREHHRHVFAIAGRELKWTRKERLNRSIVETSSITTAMEAFVLSEVVQSATSPSGNRIAVTGRESSGGIYDLTSRSIVGSFQDLGTEVGHVTFIDESTLAIATAEFAIAIVDILVNGKLEERIRFHGHEDGVNAIAAAPSGDWIATAASDQTIRIWSVQAGEVSIDRIPIRAYPMSPRFSSNGRFMAGSAGNTALPLLLNVWDLEKSVVQGTARGMPLYFSADSGTLVTLDYETRSENGYAGSPTPGKGYSGFSARAIQWWSLNGVANAVRRTVPLSPQPEPEGELMAVAISPDGKQLVVGGKSRKVSHYETSTGKRLGTLFETDHYIVGLAFSPDSRHVGFTGSQSGFYEIESGKLHVQPGLRQGLLTRPAFSPDGRWFAYSPLDLTIRMVDMRDFAVSTVVTGGDSAVKFLNFSADSRVICAGERSGTTRLWDIVTGRELANFPLDRWCAFSPDGRYLVGGTEEVKAMRVRD